MDDRGATWGDLGAEAPELAERVRGRFAANRHHVIATLRADGSPRLSGIEVAIDGEHLTVGMMPGSRKLADVERDPRVELHSAPLEDDLASGDAKVTGRLVAAPTPADGQPGRYFRLVIERASLVRVEGDELVITTWRPDEGQRVVRRR